jgi:1-acyl-sn-glycerol-3-phosphate acyltransferase
VNFAEVRAFRFLVDVTFRTCFRLHYTGCERIPREGPVVIASNHPSYLDPILLQHGTDRWVRYIAERWILELPLFGPLARTAGMLPVGDDTGSRGDALWRAIQVLEAGGVVGIFPEGWRTRVPPMGPAKRGLGRLALVPGTVVVPAAIFGSGRAWPRGFALPMPSKISVAFLPPMRFDRGRDLQEIADEVRRVIVAELMKHPIGLPPRGAPDAVGY